MFHYFLYEWKIQIRMFIKYAIICGLLLSFIIPYLSYIDLNKTPYFNTINYIEAIVGLIVCFIRMKQIYLSPENILIRQFRIHSYIRLEIEILVYFIGLLIYMLISRLIIFLSLFILTSIKIPLFFNMKSLLYIFNALLLLQISIFIASKFKYVDVLTPLIYVIIYKLFTTIEMILQIDSKMICTLLLEIIIYEMVLYIFHKDFLS